MNDMAISVKAVSKKYTIGKQQEASLRGVLGNLFSGKQKIGEDFWALKNINFEIKKGEAVGIIGKNGAGKSTLLKILSQITKPTSGRIEINGRVSSLLEVGTGFHAELTGRENIFLNGTILGMSRNEVKNKFDEIVDFSGVEKFIDTPVKHYSSGMYVRLAFAVAAHLEPEILIVDEVLAVGDSEFQKKCLGKMEDVSKNHGRTVLFVSHNMGAIEQMCNHGILLNSGELIGDGPVKDIISQYIKNNHSSNSYTNLNSSKDIYFEKIELINSSTGSSNLFLCNHSIDILFSIKYKIKIDHTFRIIIRVMNNEKQILFSSETPLLSEKYQYKLSIPPQSLTKGAYS